ncbi:hypothetical protein ACH5RR_005699 [Cinchona calisaya]|uniref:Protein FAR1-RELATED SEQUENCE n=1 Tax=Cinchona calisaya TaxID=153742 RepID=A0ABD3ALX4_9GENT
MHQALKMMDDEPLLSYAQEFYALDSFSIFKHEYKKSRPLSLNVTCEDHSSGGLLFKYEVERSGHFCSHSYKVTALAICGDNVIVNCCCNYFANTGILCSHALQVLQCLRLEKIPDCYLLKWRMKSWNDKDSFFQKRRHCRPSLDDCLSGEIGKSSVETDAFGDDVCTDADHCGAPILRHAKDIYVSKMYDLFHDEYKKSEYLFTRIGHETMDRRGIVVEIEVRGYGGRGQTKVHAETNDGTVNCGCRKFEYSGILCCHALAVLACLCIVRIPTKYMVF